MTTAQLCPYLFYSEPEKTSDGEGGWEYGLPDPTIIYMRTHYHEAVLYGIMRKESAVTLYDVVIIDEEFYKVMAFTSTDQALYKKVTLDKIDKPIYING